MIITGIRSVKIIALFFYTKGVAGEMFKRLREKLRRKWKELLGQGRVPTPDK